MAERKEIAECFKKIYVTPQGEASYPHLVEPNTRFYQNGRYELTMYFSTEEGMKLVQMLEEAYNQAGKEAQAKWEEQKPQYKQDKPRINYDQFYKEEVDENGFATGRIMVRFSQSAKFTTKDGKEINKEIAVFDRHNKAMTKEQIKKAGGGSIVKCAFKPAPYFVLGTCSCGLSLKMEAVQVIEAKEWNGVKSASDYGFQSFEDEDEKAFESYDSKASEEDIDF